MKQPSSDTLAEMLNEKINGWHDIVVEEWDRGQYINQRLIDPDTKTLMADIHLDKKTRCLTRVILPQLWLH